MPRIACLRIPKFQIAVQQKHEQCDEVLYKITERKLIADLLNCSPKIKVQEMGVILLDASGLSLRGGESKFCHHVLKTTSMAGFTDAYIGIADSAFAAMIASISKHRRINIIENDKDAQFLAPLSIKHLNLPDDIEDTLLVLGITNMGKLASIPISELNARFAKASEIVWKPWELAQGIDNRQPTLPALEKVFECVLDLGSAASQFNEILFALKAMLDRLINDLKQNGLLAQELIVSLYHETQKFDERTLPLMQPTNESKFLLEIIRLSLNAKPLTRELTSIKLAISRFTNEKWEQTNLDKLENNSKDTVSESANTKLKQAELLLLQRFAARLGKSKIFKAQASDQYLSENAGVWVPIANDSINNSIKANILPLDLNYLQEKGHRNMLSDLVLRPTLPAPEVLVQLSNAKPAAVNYRKRWYKIKCITTPEYLSSQWWSNAISKDYYKILVEPVNAGQQTLLMLLTHDKLRNNWHVEGIYD